MKRIALLLAAALAVTPALAGGPRRGPPPEGPPPQTHFMADHNGSLMSIDTDRGNITISYMSPKPWLQRWGVFPGTVLFRGGWRADSIVGTAYVFGCGPIPYEVTGRPEPDGTLVLRGPAPIVAIFPFCGVIGWGRTKNSVLVFTPLER
jgi:hypothetical protein